MTHTTTAEVRHWEPGLSPNLRIAKKLMWACALRFGEMGQGAPYWFDPVGLSPEDEDLLLQLAHCVTVGPLAGSTLRLVAAPSPRGENAADAGRPISERRADRARRYLVDHGLPPVQVATGSEADAGPDVPLDGRIDVEVVSP